MTNINLTVTNNINGHIIWLYLVKKTYLNILIHGLYYIIKIIFHNQILIENGDVTITKIEQFDTFGRLPFTRQQTDSSHWKLITVMINHCLESHEIDCKPVSLRLSGELTSQSIKLSSGEFVSNCLTGT